MFGLGKVKFIPGTFGSLATTIILFYLFHVVHIQPIYILTCLIIIFIYSFSALGASVHKVDDMSVQVELNLPGHQSNNYYVQEDAVDSNESE